MSGGARRGVTLIETLVVLGLVALLASIAVLSAPAARSSARDEAERFAAKLDAAHTLAIATGAPVKVEITGAGYSFSSYRDRAWTEIVAQESLRKRAFRRDVAVTLVSVDAALADAAASSPSGSRERDRGARQFLVDPLGGGGETSVEFADGGGRWMVAVDGSGAVKVIRDAR